MPKDGAARHKGICTSVSDGSHIVGLDASVHLQANGFAARRDPLPHLLDFFQGTWDETLPAKARVHAHDQDQIKLLNDPIQDTQRLGWVEGQAHLTAVRLDDLNASVNMRTGVGVKADEVRPCFGKRTRQVVHGLHHQVNINRNRHLGRGFGDGLDGLTDHGAKTQVGHIVVVHDIKVNPMGPRIDHVFDLFAQTGEVR